MYGATRISLTGSFYCCVLHCQGGGVVQNSGPDPFEVSDAATMLNYLKAHKK
jgi:hypothetical protein